MSKTKAEILGQPAWSHDCASFIEVDTRQEVLKAMDTYAEQRLKEYKEKLIYKIGATSLLNDAAKMHIKNLIDL